MPSTIAVNIKKQVASPKAPYGNHWAETAKVMNRETRPTEHVCWVVGLSVDESETRKVTNAEWLVFFAKEAKYMDEASFLVCFCIYSLGIYAG